MTIAIAAYVTVVGALLAVAALALEQAAAWMRLPRRWPWAAALVSTLALTCWLPWRAPAAPSDFAVTSVDGPIASVTTNIGRWWIATLSAGPASTSSSADRLALAAWAVASISLLAIYTAGIVSLHRRRARWPAAAIGTHRVFVSDDVGPAVVGVWSTAIVVPEWALALEPTHLTLLLRHERAHQTARDSMLVHLGELALAAVPWHPAAWWMRARLRAAIEIDCDARVLKPNAHAAAPSAADLDAYGTLLLTVASRRRIRSIRLVPALIERPSVLERRILAMQPIAHRFFRSRFAAASLIAAGLATTAVLLPVPALHAQYDKTHGAYVPGTPGLQSPTVLRVQKPVYTPEAMAAKIAGSVQVKGVVTAKGRFENGHVTKSLDKIYGLDEAALKAADLWIFRPATLRGRPVPMLVTLDMNFTLR